MNPCRCKADGSFTAFLIVNSFGADRSSHPLGYWESIELSDCLCEEFDLHSFAMLTHM